MLNRRKWLGAVGVGVSATLVLGACSPPGGDEADGAAESSVTWIVNGAGGGWNHNSPEGGSVYVIQFVHGVLPATGQWDPNAEWQWNDDLIVNEPELLEEDPMTWEYEIHPDAQWSDGEPIDADDFIWQWKMNSGDPDLCTDNCNSRNTAFMSRIDSVEGSDDGKTVTITMNEGEPFPEWFTFGDDGLYPAHIAEEQGFDLDDPDDMLESSHWFNENIPPVSGSHYEIESGELDGTVVKTANEEYWGEQPGIEEIILEVNTEEGSWIPALENGEVQGTSPATWSDDIIEQLEHQEDVEYNIESGASWEHIDVNMEHEFLSDDALREAVFTAIDVENIATRTYGENFPEIEPLTNYIFPNNSEYHEDVITDLGQGSGDAEAALEILEDAGYDTDGELSIDGEAVPPLRFRYTAGHVAREIIGELVQSDLEEIGLTIEIDPTEDLGGSLAEADFDLFLYGWSTDPSFANNPFDYWHSNSASNHGHMDVPEIDEAAAEVMNVETQDEAAELANEAARLTAEQAYVLPLVNTPTFYFADNNYVENITDNNEHGLRAVWNHHEWVAVD